MFKKNDMVQIKLETIVRFFDLIAEEDTFKLNAVNQIWLWRKLQFIIDFFNHNNLETIPQQKLIELMYAENHKLFFSDDTNDTTKNNIFSLNEVVLNEPIVKSLSHIISSAWDNFYFDNYESVQQEKFSKKHFLSIVNISVFSLIFMGIVYSWKIFGPISLIGISVFFLYKKFKQFFIKLQNHKEEKAIQKEIKTLIKDKNDLSSEMITKLGIEPWTNDREVNDELRSLKNKTIHFLSIYNKKEKNREPSMVLDVERMWNESVPLFIEKIAESSAQKQEIIKTIQSMENVLQKHIESLFWDDSFEVSASQKYWLAKETGKNI
jgi:hypothetical protein